MILDCPRCNGEVKLVDGKVPRIYSIPYLQCRDCGSVVTGATEEEAIVKWNARSEGDPQSCAHCGGEQSYRQINLTGGPEYCTSHVVICSRCGNSVGDRTKGMAFVKWTKWGGIPCHASTTVERQSHGEQE